MAANYVALQLYGNLSSEHVDYLVNLIEYEGPCSHVDEDVLCSYAGNGPFLIEFEEVQYGRLRWLASLHHMEIAYIAWNDGDGDEASNADIWLPGWDRARNYDVDNGKFVFHITATHPDNLVSNLLKDLREVQKEVDDLSSFRVVPSVSAAAERDRWVQAVINGETDASFEEWVR